MANELDSTIALYDYDAGAGRLAERQHLSTIPTTRPAGAPDTTVADIHVTAGGERVLVSNRGDDSLAVFDIGADGRLSLNAIQPCGGQVPRNFPVLPQRPVGAGGQPEQRRNRRAALSRLRRSAAGRAGSAGDGSCPRHHPLRPRPWLTPHARRALTSSAWANPCCASACPLGRRLDDTRELDLEAGGAEGNVCVALARLGWRTAWVGRLPDTPWAASSSARSQADGVDVSAVVRAHGERMGTYFIEYAAAPRPIQVIYDRADSAAAHMTVDDVDWDYLLDTRILHLTGITAAISDSCYDIIAEAVRRARAAGVLLSFDVNYRAKLWDAATAGARLRPIIAEADLLLCKAADAALLFGCTGQPQEQMQQLQALTRAPAVYCTYGADGAALLLGDDFHQQPALPVQIVDRIGSGDAFAAGVLDSWLLGAAETDFSAAMRDGLRRGVALAAIALSQYGDRILTTRAELDSVLAAERRDVVR